MKKLGWRQWVLVGAFIASLGVAAIFVVRTVQPIIYWRMHRDEPIKGWMTIGYVAHSYHVPPHVLNQALGLPNHPPDRRPLRVIAREQGRSLDDVKALLENAIVHSRPPYPPPGPPRPEGSP